MKKKLKNASNLVFLFLKEKKNKRVITVTFNSAFSLFAKLT